MRKVSTPIRATAPYDPEVGVGSDQCNEVFLSKERFDKDDTRAANKGTEAHPACELHMIPLITTELRSS
jgi:hypothetical protein